MEGGVATVHGEFNEKEQEGKKIQLKGIVRKKGERKKKEKKKKSSGNLISC
jgi:hypothetical protein